MDQLTRADYDTLIEALEAWENKEQASEILDDVFTGIFTNKLGPMPPDIKMDRDYKRARAAEEKALRKERSILLRAKLIQIRDGVEAKEQNARQP